MMTFLIRFALWLYPRLLRLYPRRFRQEFGDEMVDVFRQSVRDAAGGGARQVLGVVGRELRDWPLNCLREHLWQRNHRMPEMRLAPVSGWGALAAGAPFTLFLLSFFGFSLGLGPLLPLLFLGSGVLVAWWRGWPGWVVSWLGLLIFFGQNMLPYRLLQGEPAWNSLPRLLNMFSEVAIHTGWFVVLYLIVRRWPRHGALVFLPYLLGPWFFSMEFASEALSALVYNSGYLVLGLTAVAIAAQRSASGDVWILCVGALLFGACLTLGAVLFSPGMENAWRTFGPDLLQAIAPAAAILLLQALNAWAREQSQPARRHSRLMTAGVLLSFLAYLALGRLIGPSDLESYQLRLSPVLAGVWLLGALLVLWGGWRLRSHFSGRGQGVLAAATVTLVLLPLLSQWSSPSSLANSLTYQHPTLSTLRDLIPALQAVDGVLYAAGAGGLLLLPLVVGHLRRQTDAFPTPHTGAGPEGRVRAWLRRWRDRRQAAPTGRRLSRRRLALLALAVVLLGGGIFFATVFLPLQLQDEPYTQQVVLGDVDGDGDLDAVLANTMRLLPNAENKLMTNDGSGRFSDSGQAIGEGGTGAALVDSDGDGDLEVVIGGMGGAREYGNDDGYFAPSMFSASRAPGAGASQWTFQGGDLNGDGLDDVFMVGCCGMGISRAPQEMEWVPSPNRVLLGGDEGLVDSGQALGQRGSEAIDLGDLDGDGDLDAFVGNTQSNDESMRNDQPNEVWLNDGNGRFSDSGQLLGQQRTYAVALGDVDGDGDLDALVGNDGADELWLNDGQGGFTLGEQSWSSRRTLSVFLHDLDGDGDLDALTGHELSTTFAWWRQGLLWWNDGTGAFTRGDQRLRFAPNAALAIGDVNGDGAPDIVSGALNEVSVWFNERHGRFSAP